MTTVYLIRHGQSEGNERQVYTGWTDLPLTEEGEAQARLLAAHKPVPQPYHLVSSDLCRATETARLLSESWHAPLTVDKGFREVHFGAFENRTWKDINDKYPALAQAWSTDWYEGRAPEGESLADLYRRVLPLYKEYLALWRETTWGLVAHGGVIQAILATELTGTHEAHWRFSVEHARLIRLDYTADGYAILKALNSDCSVK